jgi:hypothetical protein
MLTDIALPLRIMDILSRLNVITFFEVKLAVQTNQLRVDFFGSNLSQSNNRLLTLSCFV